MISPYVHAGIHSVTVTVTAGNVPDTARVHTHTHTHTHAHAHAHKMHYTRKCALCPVTLSCNFLLGGSGSSGHSANTHAFMCSRSPKNCDDMGDKN
jgi:hypothetical protein